MKIDASIVKLSSERTYAKTEQTSAAALNASTHKNYATGRLGFRISNAVMGYAEGVEVTLSKESSQSTTLTYGNTTVKTSISRSAAYHESAVVAARPQLSHGNNEIRVGWISEEQRLLAMQIKEGAAPNIPSRIVNNIAPDFAAALQGVRLIPAVPRNGFRSVLANQARTQTLPNGMKLNPMKPVFAGHAEVRSMTASQMEITAFKAQGVALTEDGREISFDVDVELSRSFTERMESLNFVPRWPARLHLRAGPDVKEHRNERFLFDHDPRGVKAVLSLLSIGGGVLAVDGNGDGKVNGARELLGGFDDLAKLDGDGNGWLDENDAAFDNLMIWSMHEDGTAHLVGLIEADVGAIFLDYSATEHTLSGNSTLRNSGVYLKESGGAGTVRQIDIEL